MFNISMINSFILYLKKGQCGSKITFIRLQKIANLTGQLRTIFEIDAIYNSSS